MLKAGRALVDEMEKLYKELESNHRPPSLTETYSSEVNTEASEALRDHITESMEYHGQAHG